MRAPKINLIPREVLSLISEIDEFKGRWRATQVLAPDKLLALRQAATIESVGSSTRIEGAKLSNLEIEALLRGVKSYSFKSRDEQEVAGYAEVMEMIFSSYESISFSEGHLKQLHNVLLKYSVKDERHRGEYKKFSNSVEAFGPDGKSKGVIFHTASPFETPKLTQELIDWTNAEFRQKELHPLIVVSLFAVVFLHIHPFQDGNGRLSRALTTLLLLKHGYTYVPYSSFERVIEENKDSYYMSLRKAQAELEISSENKGIKRGSKSMNEGVFAWVIFFLKSMQKQKLVLEGKLNTELAASSIPRLSLEIIEIVKSRGSITLGETLRLLKANRNTLKVHFRNLVKSQVLERNGVGRAIYYKMKSKF